MRGCLGGLDEVMCVKHAARGPALSGPSAPWGVAGKRSTKRTTGSCPIWLHRLDLSPLAEVAGSLSCCLRRTQSGLGPVRTQGMSVPFSPGSWHLGWWPPHTQAALRMPAGRKGSGLGATCQAVWGRVTWGLTFTLWVGTLRAFQVHR